MKNITRVMAVITMVTSIRAVAMIDEIKASKTIINAFRKSVALFLDDSNDMCIAEHANNFEEILHRMSTLRNNLLDKYRETHNRKYYMLLKIIESVYKHAAKFHNLFANRPTFFISFIRSLKKISDELMSKATKNMLERRIDNLKNALNSEELAEFDEIIKIMNDIQSIIPKNKWHMLQIVRAVWNR